LQAWVTLGRAQLNYGEPDNAIESFDRALALKVSLHEAWQLVLMLLKFSATDLNTTVQTDMDTTCQSVRFYIKISQTFIQLFQKVSYLIE